MPSAAIDRPQAYEPTRGALAEGRDLESCPVTISSAPVLLSLMCILFEAADILWSQFVVWSERAVHAKGMGKYSHRKFSFSSSLFEGENLLQPRSEAISRIARSVLLLIISFDWLLLVAKCSVLVTHFVPLRPVFLILSSAALSSTISSIIATLFCTRGMRSVAVCFLTLWLLGSMLASTVLRSQGNGIEVVLTDCDEATPLLHMPSHAPAAPPPPPPPPTAGHVDSLNAYSCVHSPLLRPSQADLTALAPPFSARLRTPPHT